MKPIYKGLNKGGIMNTFSKIVCVVSLMGMMCVGCAPKEIGSYKEYPNADRATAMEVQEDKSFRLPAEADEGYDEIGTPE